MLILLISVRCNHHSHPRSSKRLAQDKECFPTFHHAIYRSANPTVRVPTSGPFVLQLDHDVSDGFGFSDSVCVDRSGHATSGSGGIHPIDTVNEFKAKLSQSVYA